eukprot:5436871-Alexandrium_andersonii.AAC.1
MNVRTLDDTVCGKGARAVPGRRAAIMQQCADQRLHIVGLQEARSSVSCLIQSQHYISVSSAAASKRSLGCELWIARSWQSGPDGAPQLK